MAKPDSQPRPPSPISSGNSVLETKPQQERPRTSNPSVDKAVKTFLQPRRILPTTAQRSLLNTASASRIQISGNSIQCYTWHPTSPTPSCPDHPLATVLLSHGYGANAASMLHFAPPLLAANFRVMAVDHVGHGESDGTWADLAVFVATIRHLALGNPPLGAIVGHSAGATTAVMALAETPSIHCPVVVCLSPPTKVDVLLQRFCAANGWNVGLGREMERLMVERRVTVPTDVRGVLARASVHTKVLVVHDQGDRVVPVADVKWLAEAVSGTMLLTQGLGHFKGLADPDVVEKASTFVISRGEGAEKRGLKM